MILRTLRRLIIFVFLAPLSTSLLSAQMPPSPKQLVDQLPSSTEFPPKLLATRTAVFHSHTMTEKELKVVQEYLQRTGIDAVFYFPVDMLTAGKDVMRAFADLLNKREISNILFLERDSDSFRVTVTTYNGKETIVDEQQACWSVSNRILIECLKLLQRSAQANLKKENLLINDVPETEITVNPILGKRNEFFAVDMKVDMVAVPRFGDESMDKDLSEIFTAHFPFPFKLVDPAIGERDLRKQGMLYIFCLIHARAEVARELLGYKSTKSESAFVSVTYPDGQQQLKTIPSNTEVYKVYFKHIDSGNVFLGTKWDADVTWQQALINNIKAMKAELRLN
jgi:hypothetical protein